MAPEQARAQAIDERADLFSLGCVLYEALTGRRPFDGPTVMAVLAALENDEPSPPHHLEADVPPELSRLIMRMNAKDPNGRPRNAQEVAETMDQIAQEKSRHRQSRRWPVFVALGLGAAGIAALVGVVIITFKAPGGGTTEVRVRDDRTVEFDKNGGMTIKQGPPAKPDAEVPGPPTNGILQDQPTAAEAIQDFVACHGLSGKQFDTWLAKEANILHAASSETLSKTWKLRVKREARRPLCLVGISTMTRSMAALKSAKLA